MAKGNTVQVTIVGDSSKFDKVVTNISTKSEGLGRKIAGVFGGLQLDRAVQGVMRFGKDSVAAFVESEQSALKLEDAFARFPKLADSNAAAFQKLNEQMAKKTRFDDDAIASGQAVLAQFNLTGKQIQEMTPLVADFAAKTGRDVPAAAELLGKAMLGNTRALKEVGISLDFAKDAGKNLAKAQDAEVAAAEKVAVARRKLADLQAIQATKDNLTIQDQIALRNAREGVSAAEEAHAAAVKKVAGTQEAAAATGDKFTQIMGGLRKQVGGFAEKEGTTAAGKSAILANQFGELQEMVGAKLVPVLHALTSAGLGVINFITNLSPGMQMAIGIGTGLLGLVFMVTKAVQAWTAVQAALNVVLTANPIGLVVVAIAALVAGIVWAYNNVDWFRDGVQAAFRGMAAAGEWLGRVFSAVWGGIVGGFQWVTNTLRSLANWLIRNVVNRFVDGVNLLIRAYNTVNVGQTDMRMLAHLPAFHKGGVVPGAPGTEVPIMAEAGETVIPAGGRVGTTVNINLNVPNYVGDKQELVTTVVAGLETFMARGGLIGDGRGRALRPS